MPKIVKQSLLNLSTSILKFHGRISSVPFELTFDNEMNVINDMPSKDKPNQFEFDELLLA